MTPPADTEFRLRDIWWVAYGPSVVSSVGHGAVMPVLALRARDLGADVATAAAVVAVLSLGMLAASLPAGALVARIGERTALLAVGAVDAVAMSFAALTDSVLGLSAAVFLSGMSWTVFLIARQGFLIDAVPEHYRARAMSMLGGTYRIGVLVGPLLGAGLLTVFGLPSVFWLAGAMSVVSAVMARMMPDFGKESRDEARATGHLSVWAVIREHRRTLATLGVAVVILGASRSLRASLLPLWAENIGISASTTSLIFAVAAAVDVAFMWPGGWLMDTRGRAVVAVPVVLSMAVACLLLPLATTAVGVTLVMLLIAVGNGLGSGIVMTTGADVAPAVGRAQFLGAWRLCGDIGNSGGPLMVSAVAAVAPLATASLVVGGLALLGTGWVGYWTRRLGLSRRSP
ncbi:MAG: MFS transporter [Nocardioides sp.]|nr:MFS transporter [Nocardioides sp.]